MRERADRKATSLHVRAGLTGAAAAIGLHLLGMAWMTAAVSVVGLVLILFAVVQLMRLWSRSPPPDRGGPS